MTTFGRADQSGGLTPPDPTTIVPHGRLGGLVERERELGVLTSAGVGSFVVIEGPAGIGKTCLLDAARARHGGPRVLAAGGSELTREFPFGMVRQLLEASGSELVEAGPGTGELARLDGFIGQLATVPTILLLDDLQWADAGTLRLLATLRGRLGDRPVGVLAAMEGAGPGGPLLSTVVDGANVRRLRLRPLTAAGVAQLLADPLSGPADPEFAAACVEATAGNPFRVQALVRAVQRAGLRPVREHLAAVPDVTAPPVPCLEPAARDLAEALAVLGPDTLLATLTAMVSTSDLKPLMVTGLVRLTQDRLSFVHPIVGRTVYDGLSSQARARTHHRAADVLAAEGRAPERVAAHVLRTPPGLDPQAGPRLRRAAEEAVRRGSPDAALSLFDRLLQEDLPAHERLAGLRQAGEIALRVDRDAAVRLLSEAHRNAPDDASIATRLGSAYGFRSDPDRAFAAYTAALATVPPSNEDGRRRLEATLLVGALAGPGRRSVTDRLSELAALSTHHSVGGRMLSAAIAVYELAAGSPGAVDRARAAVADGVLVREVNGDGALACGWFTLLAGGDPSALPSLDDAADRAYRRGTARDLAIVGALRCLGRLWTGELAGAEADGRAALAGATELDFTAGWLADALTAQGRLDEAEEVLTGVGLPAHPASPSALEAFARLRRHQGRYAEAGAAALGAGRGWAGWGFTNPAVGGWRSEAALGLFGLGDPVGARRWAEEDLDLARRFGAPRALGRALRVSGQLTGGGDGLARLTESAEILEKSTARLEYATTLVELGAALRRSGRLLDARAVLPTARNEALRCGAGPLAVQARTELRTAEDGPGRDQLTGPGSQSRAERRVSMLAARDAPDQDIIDALAGRWSAAPAGGARSNDGAKNVDW